jgi:Concanavalin A-like lectin/glucanases superfamily
MPPRSETASFALRLGCCLGLLAWLPGCGSESSLPAEELDGAAAAAQIDRPREGFAAWESNRGGDWRIWSRGLDGGDPRQLSSDDGRQHCCPLISPDGRQVVYLSRPVSPHRYAGWETAGALRSVDPVTGAERTLVMAARTYGWGNRCAVWRDDRRLIYVDGDGRTQLLDLDDGISRPLTAARAAGELPWLIDPSLRFATSADPSFSPYDADAGRVLERGSLGGCEAYFSQDGRWGYWIAGAGGPVRRIDLATREISTLLLKNDRRMPGDQGYVYFPMLSRDGRAFAFGASADEHDHFRSNYDVYVAAADPRTFELIGLPVRLTSHPATDRYPDVFLGPSELGRGDREPPPPPDLAPAEAAGEAEDPAAWPNDRRGLVFLWQTGDAPNLVYDPELGADVSYPLESRGRARLDHDYAMVLDGGAFVAPPEAARALLAAVKASGELTLEATLRTGGLAQAWPAAIVAFADGRRQRHFTFGQDGNRLVLRLGAAPLPLQLSELDADRTLRLTVTYSPGWIQVYRDGEPTMVVRDVREDFGPWEPGDLLFGDEAGGGADWSGTLEGIALFDRALSPAEVRADHLRYRRMLERRPQVERREVRATLRARSEIPTLDQISPYRQALAVYEYQVDETVAGEAGSGVLRVAHWVILDGETQPVAAARPGSTAQLILEPFAANPQLESHFLSQTLEPRGDLDLFYAAGR